MLDSFSSDSEPVYVNAETGEELDIDDIEDMDVVPVAVDGTSESESYGDSFVTKESVKNESTPPVVGNDTSSSTEEVQESQNKDQEEKGQEQEKSGLGMIGGLIGGAVIGVAAAFITMKLIRK